MSSKYAQLNDKEWLEEKYLEEKLSRRGIAEIVGCAESSVVLAFKRLGVTPRTISEAQQKYDFEEEWLRQKYLGERLSAVKIAKIVGCCSFVVYKALKFFNVPIRTRSEAIRQYEFDEEWLRQKYIEEKLSALRIAEIVGCGDLAIRNALKRFNIPIRTRGEAANIKLKKRRNYPKLDDKELLYKRYCIEEKTSLEIGEEIGCSFSAVVKALKFFGIPRRHYHTERTKKKISDAQSGEVFKKEQKRKLQEARKKQKGFPTHHTKIEVILKQIVEKHTDIIRYTGDGAFWIETPEMNVNPDFIVIDKKIVIEANGDYWHSPLLNRNMKKRGDVNYRRELLKKVGWKMIVLWESDLKRKDAEQFVLHVLKKEGVIK